MGAFILLCCDYRIGIEGEFRLTLPETAINMDIPVPLMTLARSRIPPNYLTRAAVQAEVCSPRDAIAAGFLDEVTAATGLDDRARAVARGFAQLPTVNYRNNKLIARSDTLARMQKELDEARKS